MRVAIASLWSQALPWETVLRPRTARYVNLFVPWNVNARDAHERTAELISYAGGAETLSHAWILDPAYGDPGIGISEAPNIFDVSSQIYTARLFQRARLMLVSPGQDLRPAKSQSILALDSNLFEVMLRIGRDEARAADMAAVLGQV